MDPLKIATVYFSTAILGLAILGYVNAATVVVGPGNSIQAAIYMAKAGDVIEVHSGVYYEHVAVNKRVVLKGVGMPVLDATASGSSITLKADGIILQGFKTINSGRWPGDGSKEAGILVLSNNNTVEDNNASNNSNGIFIIGGRNNTITGNTASNNLGYGIMLSNAVRNTIFKNNFDHNYKNNAYDDSANKWDDGNIGNYYDDFESPTNGCQDVDGNGICDVGHAIPGGSGIDRHPSPHPF